MKTAPAPALTQAVIRQVSGGLRHILVSGPSPAITYPPSSSVGYNSDIITRGRPAFAGMTLDCSEMGASACRCLAAGAPTA